MICDAQIHSNYTATDYKHCSAGFKETEFIGYEHQAWCYIVTASQSEKWMHQIDKFHSQFIVSVIVWQPTDDMLDQPCSGTQLSVGTTQPINILNRNQQWTLSKQQTLTN